MQLKPTISMFCTQKRHFWSKVEKAKITIELYILKLVHGPNFSLNWQLIFWIRFTQKWYFWSKNGKKNEYHHWILNIQISLDTSFQLKMTILFFCTKSAPKGYIWSKKIKSEHHYWILHVQISPGSNFFDQAYLRYGLT